MKKFFALMLIAPFMLAVSSCSDDDKDDDKTAIIGTWQYLQSENEVTVTPENLKDEVSGYLFNYAGEYSQDVWVFKKNGTGTIINKAEEDDSEDFTYEVKSGNIILTFTYEEDGETMTEEDNLPFKMDANYFVIIDDCTEEAQQYISGKHKDAKVTKAIVNNKFNKVK